MTAFGADFAGDFTAGFGDFTAGFGAVVGGVTVDVGLRGLRCDTGACTRCGARRDVYSFVSLGLRRGDGSKVC